MTSQQDGYINVLWRPGRTQPRNIYARVGGGDWKADVMIGQLDTGELAAEAINAHNAALANRWVAANNVTGNTTGTDTKTAVFTALRSFSFGNYRFDEVDEIIADPSLDLGGDLAAHIALALEDTGGA